MSLLLLLWPLLLTRRPEQGSPIWARRSLILLITLLTLRYLHWRCTSSLNLDTTLSTLLSLVLLMAEGWLLLTGLVPLWLAWRRYPDRREQAVQQRHAWLASTWRPCVDILVPTYGEPITVLERSLKACRRQSYPNTTVWVLDDSGRTEVEQLARSLGCRYRHRPERANAKAGNLNDGLRISEGDLIAVFDADFIPQASFLENTIGLLMDPEVALVQTPQHCINADPVMRNLAMERWMLPDEESFYRWIEPVRDGWGAVVCAGTSFLVRRRALESIGGFAEDALSEDFVTGIALREKGWRLLYLQQKLSAGLAAERMLDFVRQRQRWARGTLQSLQLPKGPLRARNLSWGVRLAYLEGVIHWVNNLPRLLLMLMPLCIGLFGVVPIKISAAALLELLLPLWGTVLLSIGWLNRSSRAALLSELTGWVLTVPLVSTLVLRPKGFRVTPKHQAHQQGGWTWSLALPLVLLSGLNAANLIGILRQGTRPEQLNAEGWGLGLVWGGLNLLGTLVALRACWDPPQEDPTPWFAVETTGFISHSGAETETCRISAISEKGAELELQPGTTTSAAGKAVLRWDGQPTPLPIRPMAWQGSRICFAWHEPSPEQREALEHWLYQRQGCWVDREPPTEWRALLALLKRALLGAPAPAPLRRSLVPIASGTEILSGRDK
ncbi:hypothetical protein KR52_06130 [Synechococcus sp. KORDI-52]|uniref:glycosyltransferase family 2 protein n=1 Tax=Synechococcus sp. KORDI-52 TaxID=585425 RepID=UPI0004E089F8|nr:cellulose synthase catalytic subunit [Synechococcus sp. KORDI-52]AII48719.1 hypothetical protein KR52_06130 [Synechococcus sp. KORDI-52]